MARSYNTDRRGEAFSEAVKRAVWAKALIVPGLNPNEWKQDSCGARIQWSKYGEAIHLGTGWEIDHIRPVAHGGGDEITNLQALQWQNNRHKSDSLLPVGCAVVPAS